MAPETSNYHVRYLTIHTLSSSAAQVEFPMDVHPLPDDISAYVRSPASSPPAPLTFRSQFVYPFTLEPHILAQQPPIHEKIRALRERYARMLDDRRREEEEKR